MDNRRLILLCALAGLIFLMWQAWQKDYSSQQPAKTSPPATASKQANSASQPSTNGNKQSAAQPNGPNLPAPKANAEAAPSQGKQAKSATVPQGRTITVTTDLMVVKINVKGGGLRQVKLLNYSVSSDKPHQKLNLLSGKLPYFFVAQSGLTAKSGKAPGSNSPFTAKHDQYTLTSGKDTLSVPLHWQGPHGRSVTKVYTFHRGSYQIGLKEHATNGQQARPWHVGQYVRLWRTPNSPTKNPRFMRSFLGIALYQQKDDSAHYKFRKISFDDIDDKPVNEIQTGGWVSMDQHYFLAAAIPPSKSRVRYYVQPQALPGGQKAYVAGFVGEQHKIAPGGEHEFDTKFFIGPKLQDVLPSVAPGLGQAVDYGYVTIIAKPVFWVMSKLHGLIGNWGWAIVLITLFIRLAFYKLSEAQYRSMARMKKFGPRMKQIKERFGDDREKMQKAMMDLYKKEGFNPLGGCWPMVVQFPVFIALYWVLRDSVELRQAPWILWIQNLAAPDPLYILPVLYGISMFFQQRLSGNSMAMDDMQRKMMMLMPVGLAIFFSFFPAGLVLYWIVSNLVSITQQWIITRRVETAPAKR